MLDFVSHYPSLDALYAAYTAHLRQCLAASERLSGRPLAAVWQDLAGLAFEQRHHLQFPPESLEAASRMSWVHHHLCGFHVVCSRHHGICTLPQASWLQLGDSDLHRFLGYLYDQVGTLSVAAEAAFIAALVDPDYPEWSPL